MLISFSNHLQVDEMEDVLMCGGLDDLEVVQCFLCKIATENVMWIHPCKHTLCEDCYFSTGTYNVYKTPRPLCPIDTCSTSITAMHMNDFTDCTITLFAQA